jgi:outer membrane lipoprotein carrier protein
VNNHIYFRQFGVAFVLLTTLSRVAVGQAVVPVNASAAISANIAAVAQLETILAATTSLSANVEQLLMDQDGRELQETKAQLVMQKPQSFYWATTAPYEELMVTDGNVIWRYEPDLDQVTLQSFDSDINRTPVMLLNGDAHTIGEAYTVSATTMTDQVHTRFILLPKNPGSLFDRLSLTFNGVVLEEMQFEDSLGQQTSLTFSQALRNQMVDSSKFQFVVPAGVDVIDNTRE